LDTKNNVKSPVFILANPRSFTSLICAMLGQHPEAYGVPELNLLVCDTLEALMGRFSNIRQFQQHGLLRTVAHLYSGEQTIASIDMARRWVLAHLKWSTGEVYKKLCCQVAPLRIIDKSPAYALDVEVMERLYRVFPNAYFIHLVRHPRTQGLSIMNTGDGFMAVASKSYDYTTDPPTLDPQFAWYATQNRILKFLSTVPSEQQMFLRGEDLLNDPPVYFEKICQWLGLSWTEAAYEAILNPDESPFACPGPYGTTMGNDPNFLNSPYFKQRYVKPSSLEGTLAWRTDGKGFIPEVVELAQRLGYH